LFILEKNGTHDKTNYFVAMGENPLQTLDILKEKTVEDQTKKISSLHIASLKDIFIEKLFPI